MFLSLSVRSYQNCVTLTEEKNSESELRLLFVKAMSGLLGMRNFHVNCLGVILHVVLLGKIRNKNKIKIRLINRLEKTKKKTRLIWHFFKFVLYWKKMNSSNERLQRRVLYDTFSINVTNLSVWHGLNSSCGSYGS